MSNLKKILKKCFLRNFILADLYKKRFKEIFILSDSYFKSKKINEKICKNFIPSNLYLKSIKKKLKKYFQDILACLIHISNL